MQSQALVEQKFQATEEQKQFFTITATTPTLCASMCVNNGGGCYAFGSALTAHLNKDSVHVVGRQSSEKLSFFKEKVKHQPYKTIIFTGCNLYDVKRVSSAIQGIESKYHSTKKVENIVIVYPPHLENLGAYTQDLFIKRKFFSIKYNFIAVTTGVQINLAFNIGFPNFIPENRISAFNVPIDSFGLIYINLLVSPDESFEVAKSESIHYLNHYFTLIKKIARCKGVSTPTVIAITRDPSERKIILMIAREHNIQINFVDFLPQADFLKAIEIIGKKSFIASNGTQTFMEATLLGARTLFLNNLKNNANFVTELLNLIPSHLKETAAVILGLSKEYAILNDKEKVKKTTDTLHALFKQSSQKFKHFYSTICTGSHVLRLCAEAVAFLVPPKDMENPIAQGLARAKLKEGLALLHKAESYRSSLSFEEIKKLEGTWIKFAICYKDLGGKFYASKNFQDAECCYKTSLEIYEKLSKKPYESMLIVLSNLVTVAFQKKDYKMLEKFVAQAETQIIPELKEDQQPAAIIGKIYYHKAHVKLLELKKLSGEKPIVAEKVQAIIQDIEKCIEIVTKTSQEKAEALTKKLNTYKAVGGAKEEPKNKVGVNQ